MSTLPSDERLDGGHRADGRHALAEEAAAGPRRASRLSVEDLEFEIGGVRILDRVSFSLARGELVCVMGPSGSGKTTLLKCLNRLLEPTGGRVFLDGADTASFSPVALRRRIGMVWQTPFMFEGTVRGNLRRAVQLSGSGVGDEMFVGLLELVAFDGDPDADARVCLSDSSSAFRSRGRWPADQGCCCATSRRRRSTMTTRCAWKPRSAGWVPTA
jgi:ABC-type sugar transport system ATPase subunit